MFPLRVNCWFLGNLLRSLCLPHLQLLEVQSRAALCRTIRCSLLVQRLQVNHCIRVAHLSLFSSRQCLIHTSLFLPPINLSFLRQFHILCTCSTTYLSSTSGDHLPIYDKVSSLSQQSFFQPHPANATPPSNHPPRSPVPCTIEPNQQAVRFLQTHFLNLIIPCDLAHPLNGFAAEEQLVLDGLFSKCFGSPQKSPDCL